MTTENTPSLEELPTLSTYLARSVINLGSGDGKAGLERLREISRQRWSAGRIREFLAAATPATAARLMRTLRRQVLCALMVRDATGVCGYEEVADTMTALAEETVDLAVRIALRELSARFGVPSNSRGEPEDLLVVGMGKLGGAELNVSSDIDLIFCYAEDGQTQPGPSGRSIDNKEFFTRAVRRIVPLLSDPTGGFVFRVDTRLRPNGDAGPAVVSADMLEEYLMVQGREWERFAWLKGRIVNRAVFCTPQAFEQQKRLIAETVRPFVFRRYVDYGAMQAIRSVHALIGEELGRRGAEHPDRSDNIKLGRGGIREIEFIAQTFQIIRGGSDPELRSKSTLATLSALGSKGIIDSGLAQLLAQDYVFLRNLEHAIQYVDDKQTQVMPSDSGQRGRIARLAGLAPEAMLGQLAQTRQRVGDAFVSLFDGRREQDHSGWPDGWQVGSEAVLEELSAGLSAQGFPKPGEAAGLILALMSGRSVLSASRTAKERLVRLVPSAVAACLKASRESSVAVEPEAILDRMLRLLRVIAGRGTYLALLEEYPSVLGQVCAVLAKGQWAADYLTHHPIVLDEAVGAGDPVTDDHEGAADVWEADLRQKLAEAEGDQELQMNLIRDAHHARVFRLLIEDVADRIAVEKLADHLSALADRIIGIVIELAWKTLPGRHRERPAFAAFAYGKLGSKELGYTSDLDLTFVYEDSDPRAPELYAKLVRRIATWLTARTSSGQLFEVDMRLRPNGVSGLSCSSLAAFCKYQQEEAWPWEHQALTKARFVAGDVFIGERLEAERLRILCRRRDPAQLLGQVSEMRAKMLENLGSRQPGFFNLKHDRGGMVDVEFAVQAMILLHAADCESIRGNLGNAKLLRMMARLGMLAESVAEPAVAAYRHMRALHHAIGLASGHGALVPEGLPGLDAERAAVVALWRAVFGEDGPQKNPPAA